MLPKSEQIRDQSRDTYVISVCLIVQTSLYIPTKVSCSIESHQIRMTMGRTKTVVAPGHPIM